MAKRGRKPIPENIKIQMIEDYVIEKNYSKVAKMHGVSTTTVKRIVGGNEKAVKTCEKRAEEISDDIMLKLRVDTNKIMEFTDYLLSDTMRNKEKLIKAASLQQRTTVFGIFMDKLLKYKEMTFKERELDFKERALLLKEKDSKNLEKLANTEDIKKLFEGDI